MKAYRGHFHRRRRNRVAISLCAAALLCLPAAAQKRRRAGADDLKKGAVIDSVTVLSHEVFELSSGRGSKLLYGLANSFHSKTRELVIRRELLFKVGDPYDGALLRETERNLRSLDFIRRARVTATLNSRGKVDVIVRTYDAWSLEVVASFKRAGGVSSTKLGLAEHNVFGRGKSLAAAYQREGRSASQTFAWKDPQFLNKSHLEYSMALAVQPGARSAAIGLRRPFYASIARSALGFNSSYVEGDASTYSNDGLETGLVRKRVGEAGVEYGVALATSTERVRRVNMGLLFRRANYGHSPRLAPGPRPDPEQAYFLKLGAEWNELDFIKENQIQKFSRDEDFNLGLAVSPSLSWAPPGLRALNSSESQVLPKLVVRKGFSGGDELLLLRGGYSSAYINGATGNRTVSGDVLYFLRGLPRQTLAFHAAYAHGWRLDPSALLALGESNGLRGYGLSQFSGDRRFLFNMEDRLFIYNGLFRLLDLGAVAFFDSGYVWPAKRAIRVWDLRSSVGIGLRVAPSRSASNSPVRIDFARALSSNGTSSRWAVSILAGHAFGTDSD